MHLCLKTLTFAYDAAGNRIKKETYYYDDPDTWYKNTTYYTRDAQGNVLAVYDHKTAPKDDAALVLSEVPLYGSSRLGEWRPRRLLDLIPLTDAAAALLGEKTYELSNHLGNVLAVVSDGEAIVSATDYYAFGQEMPGRTYSSDDYRYGFNGKENDSEWGESLIQDYGMRLYNPALCRFLSVDPLTHGYAELTPFQFASNTPIQAIDLDGLEAAYVAQSNIDNIDADIKHREEVITSNADWKKYCTVTNPSYEGCTETKRNPPNLKPLTKGIWKFYPVKNLVEVANDVKRHAIQPIIYIQHHAHSGGAGFTGVDPNSFEMCGDGKNANKPFDIADIEYYIHTVIEKKDGKSFKCSIGGANEEAILTPERSWGTKKTEIDALYEISQKVDNDGYLILGGCNLANYESGDSYMKVLSKLNPRINWVANKTYSGNFCLDKPIETKFGGGEWAKYKAGSLQQQSLILTPQSDDKQALLLEPHKN